MHVLELGLAGAAGLVAASNELESAALLVLPSLVTNVWQLLAGPSLLGVLRRLAVVMVFICLGTALGIGFMTQGASRWPSLLLGIVLAAYGVIGLFAPRLAVSRRHETWLGPLVGCATGLLTGATGVFVVPAVPYLSALGLSKDELVQALGLSFTVSTVALAGGLLAAGSFRAGLALGSLAAVIPALLGMFIGQALRSRLDPVAFRRWFFWAMILVGLYMAARATLTM